MDTRQRLTAADIPDDSVFAVIGRERYPRWQLVADALPTFPPKLVLAKVRAMVRKHQLAADCTCGCGAVITRTLSQLVPIGIISQSIDIEASTGAAGE